MVSPSFRLPLPVKEYPTIITIGETPFTHDAAEVVKYVQPERKELNMVFVFELQKLGVPRLYFPHHHSFMHEPIPRSIAAHRSHSPIVYFAGLQACHFPMADVHAIQ